MAASPQVATTVLSAVGRRDLQGRLDRAREALAVLSGRIRTGERGAEELAEHQHLTSQIEELTAVLARAGDIATIDEDPRIVELGDEVDLEMADGAIETYALVHPVETNAAGARISVTSPLGRAVLGARPGDRVTVDAPAGPYTCTVRARRRLA